jgi:osmotically-inducible protein OsmY
MVAGLCLGLGAPGSLWAQTTDTQLKAGVERRLADRKAKGIKVSAAEGRVTLTGSVTSAGAKADLIAEAFKVEGVKEVVSELSIGKAENDRTLAERTIDQVRRSPYFTVFDEVQINVDRGSVTLSGYVTQPIKADDLVRRVSHVEGVLEFTNRLEVLPVSPEDDRLRNVIANTLYRDPTFSNYATQAVPPIHIIVRRSSVLLTGVVNSEVERRLAETIVRGIGGIVGVQNALQVEQ